MHKFLIIYLFLLSHFLFSAEAQQKKHKTLDSVNEINIAGSGSAFECWYKGILYQTDPTYHTMETCVTMTWMKLCLSLLRVNGNPVYADQFEKSTYNALMASLKYDGSEIAKYRVWIPQTINVMGMDYKTY